jgi:Putative DNA-binding domain
VALPGLRRLSLADLDDAALRQLVGEGEHLFVERKQAPPKDGIGRFVASFANALGGWLLLGVADDGSLVGYSLPGRADPQSHVGQLLAAEVDPLPPYVATARQLDGTPLVIVRVFESADTPHIIKATGAVPIRTPKGTENVSDQRLLLELARKGEEALERARQRLSMDLIVLELAAPERPELVAVGDAEPYAIVRASLVTPTAQFASWAISQAAAGAAERSAAEVARILGMTIEEHAWQRSVRGRGVAVGCAGGFHVPVRIKVAVDAGGTVGARLSRGVSDGTATLHSFESEYISPLVLAVGDLLRRAEAFGRAAWRVDVGIPREDFEVTDAERHLNRPFFASAEAAVPLEHPEAATLINSWCREFARELGVEAWG